MNNDYIYYKKYENKGITYVKDILDSNCECLDYITLNEKYDIGASFLNIYAIKVQYTHCIERNNKAKCLKIFHLEILLKLTTQLKQ